MMTKKEWDSIYIAVETFKEQEAWSNVNPKKLQKELKNILSKIKLTNEDEDMGLGYSIVKSNDAVEGVFIRDSKIIHIDYFDE